MSSTAGSDFTQELLLKFLIVGDYGVGKTAIVRRYMEGKFSPGYRMTLGADFAIKSMQWDEQTKIHLQLWDVPGRERFGYLTKAYYKYAVAAVVVFDLSRMQTFYSVLKWLRDLRQKVTLSDGTHIPVILLANKCDINETVLEDTAIMAKFCNDNHIETWFATSAKENINIDDAMLVLIDKVMNPRAQETNNDAEMLFRTSDEGNERTSSCCW
jgi:Ras-related protein Rab-32